MGKGLIPRAREALWGTPEEKPTKTGKAIISTYEGYGTRPDSTFRNQVIVFEKDAVVRESIIHTAMEIIGTGIFTTYNEDYKVILPNGESKRWTAKEAIDQWNELNNTDEKLLTIAIELVAYGNSFLYITPTGFKHINIECIGRALPSKSGVPIIEQYDIELTGGYYGKKLTFGSYIHFRSNVTSSSEPFGTGVVAGLIESYDTNTPTLLETRNSIRESMKAGFEKFGQPNELWIFEQLSDDAIAAVGKQVKELPKKGGRLSTNVKGDIKTPLPERVHGYDEWVKQMFDEFIMSLGDPSLKASIESGFTEASIKGSIELFRKKVQAFRRIIKRQIEAVWGTVLREYGFSSAEAQVKLNFGAEEIEWTVADLLNAVNNQTISPEEARAVLREKARWKLEGAVPAKKEPQGDGQNVKEQ